MNTLTPKSSDNSRWALVTGASAGIGKEFCRQLAAAGFHLVLVARRADRLHALASELKQEYSTATLVIPADLADPDSPARIAEQVHEENIFIEFLVNNAGFGLSGTFKSVAWKDHQAFIELMMTAVCSLTWQLLPDMQAKKAGYIINVASVAGMMPSSAGHTLYGATKAFLIKFSESLALENAPHGIKVSALCPGFTYSEFHDVTGTREQVSQLPSYLWLQTEDVVRYGMDSVTRKNPRVIAIPGRLYKLLVWIAGAAPWLGRYLSARTASKFRKLD